MGEPLIVADRVVRSYPSGGTELRVLEGTSLTVEAGELVAVVGASGVGKSTLLHLLGGLDRPDDGAILFRGRSLGELSERELADYRNREVGFVFQFYHLLPEFTALENVAMPLLIGRDHESAEARAREILVETGLGERLTHLPGELSGGERQRVAIARALARNPRIVFADEPTGNLDRDTGQRVLELFRQIHRRHGLAVVMVTHNPELAAGFDRVLEMDWGGGLRPLARRP